MFIAHLPATAEPANAARPFIIHSRWMLVLVLIAFSPQIVMPLDAGFSIVLWLSPFWSNHLWLEAGVLIALILLPFYVDGLADRIKEARKTADAQVLSKNAPLNVRWIK